MNSELNKTELNGELARINVRMKFLRAAHYGRFLPKQVSDELRNLEASKQFVLSQLKK